MEGLSPLTLIVKAPNLRAEDKRVACDRSWTVRQLKEHLSTVYPHKPPEDEQKLVYFGKLLKDECCLHEVLTQDSYDDAHTVHLVCPAQSGTDKSTARPYIPRFLSAADSQQLPEQSSELRHRSAAASPNHIQHEPSMQYQQTSAPTDLYQQMSYWNSYWNQPQTSQPNLTAQQRLWAQMYQQQQNMYNLQMQSMAMYYNMASSNTVAHDPATQPVAADVNQPAAAAPPAAADDVVQLNAQGGIDADGGQRDWLDSIYSFFRFGMLLMMLYFYTTFGRFSVVFITGVFFYLAQGNFFRLQRRRQAPPQPQPPQHEQNQAENQNNENNERVNGRNVEELTEPNNNIPIADQSTWFDAVKTVITFIMTFFTSLIPQNPAAAVAN